MHEPLSSGHPRPPEPTRRENCPLSKPAPAKSTRPIRSPDAETRQMALRIAELLDEKQAKEITILDVSGPFVIADYFVVATVQWNLSL